MWPTHGMDARGPFGAQKSVCKDLMRHFTFSAKLSRNQLSPTALAILIRTHVT